MKDELDKLTFKSLRLQQKLMKLNAQSLKIGERIIKVSTKLGDIELEYNKLLESLDAKS